MMKASVCLLAILGSLTFAIGCGSGSSSSTSLPSTGPGDGDTGGEIGEVSSAGFWIDIADRSGLFDVVMSKDGDFGEDCLIASSLTLSVNGPSDCLVDVLELDSYVHEIKIQYNVPQNMCEYVTVAPSWHWNYSVGYGPSQVSIAKNSDGDLTACTVDEDDGVGTSWVNCTVAEEIFEVTDEGKIVCEYDYSTRGEGPNCCFGQYQLLTDDDGEYTEEIADWDGSEGGCAGGAFKKNSWVTTDDGLPETLIRYVENEGINGSINIPANAEGLQSSFQYGLNWYQGLTGSVTVHSHVGYVSSSASTLPYAFDPIDDLNGTSLRTGYTPRVPYTVTCLNRASEVKHQWNIYLREWNTYVDWLVYITSLGVTEDHDVVGDEGVDCEYDADFGDQCNDLYDFEDIVNSASGGVYDTTTPDNSERQTWFPGVEY